MAQALPSPSAPPVEHETAAQRARRARIIQATLALASRGGYEAVQMIRKGQVRWLWGKDVVGQVLFVNEIFGVKAA